MQLKGLLALFLGFVTLVEADTLILRDGRTIRGSYLGGDSRFVRFLPENSNRSQRYAIQDVDKLEFGSDSDSNSSSDSSSAGSRSSSSSSSRSSPSTSSNSSGTVIPAGTVITVRMIDPINSDATNVGETFRASLDEPLVVNGRTVASKGSDATVRVARVRESGRLTGSEEVTIELADLTIDGRKYAVRSSPAQVAQKASNSENVKIIGGTAVLGAIIGAIAGGGKGAAIGAASGAGAGAAIQAIRGQRVQIPSETHLDFVLAEPVQLARSL